MPKKINIIHLIPALNIGGAEKVVLNLCRHFDPARFKLTLVYWQGNDDLLPEFKKSPVQIIKLQLKTVISLNSVLKIRRLIKTTQADIIHTHFIDADLLGFLSSRFLRTAMIVDIHSYPFPDKTTHCLRYYLMSFGIKKFLCVSNTVKAVIQQKTKIPDKKIKVVYNGITLDSRYDPRSRKERGRIKQSLNIPEGHIIVGNISRLILDKGQEYLIRAMPDIIQSHKNVIALIIGDGELRDQLKQLASDLNIESHIIFTGTRTDIPELLSIMDVFVFPTFREAMGITVLEAMAAEKPIIATDDAAIPELIRHRKEGLLIHPGNEQLITQAVQALLDDKESARQYAKNARQRVSQFSLDQMMINTAHLYEDVPG
ncbi:MAG: glycosyltransferase [Candidatus Omnitrophica bacterium]|nr:glycosyltransferase [Candidatus Omnitrophota bacterium]